MIAIDTDVLLQAFAFQRDARQEANAAFLQTVRADQPATTLYNILETLGKLSFNLAPERLDSWQSWLVDAFQLVVIWPFDPATTSSPLSFREEILERPFSKMRAVHMPFMDALVLDLAERTPGVTHFVAWTACHFEDKSPLAVLTPEAYLQEAEGKGESH